MVRRAIVPRKLPVVLFGEGKSEQGYGRWLNRLADITGVPVAIRAEKLSGGDPLDLVSSALAKLTEIERNHGRHPHRALLLDSDLKGKNPKRDQLAEKTAGEKNLRLIWQSPCHEAFILRHFPTCDTLLPSNNKEALRQLKKVWPTYDKGFNAIQYGKVLGRDHLNRARAVEPDLNNFLVSIGWD